MTHGGNKATVRKRSCPEHRSMRPQERQQPLTAHQPRFDYMDMVETATQSLNSFYADSHEHHDPAEVNREAQKFASMFIDVLNQADVRRLVN